MESVDARGNFASLDTVNGQDWMVWVTQDPIFDRTQERLGDSDRGIILYRQLLQEQLKRVEAGLEPINVFRDPAQNRCIELPAPWDRGYAWGYAKDGSYIRGTVTTADKMPPRDRRGDRRPLLRLDARRQRRRRLGVARATIAEV